VLSQKDFTNAVLKNTNFKDSDLTGQNIDELKSRGAII
jgi:uncharacterized protein YjbI with pentapeptide repeats